MIESSITQLRLWYANLPSRFRRDRCGVAAVEFALILPVMLVMYLGMAEVTRGIIANRKVNLVSRTIADLTARESTTAAISSPSTELASILSAASKIISPFDTSTLALTVSSVTIKTNSSGGCCVVYVDWSYAQNGGTLRPCNTPLTQVAATVHSASTNISGGLIPASTSVTTANTAVLSLIVADVKYVYTPGFGKAMFNWTQGMGITSYMRPRDSGKVTLASTPSGGQVCS